MALQRLCLNGTDWKLLPLMPREWEWRRVWENPEAVMPALWIPAQVPGTVQEDAQEAGLIPDFAVEFNSRACEWTSERDWVYVKTFDTPPLPPDGIAWLRFEGVDWACTVFLNGQQLGAHEGMYDAFEFDVTGLLTKEGPNKLVVVCEHAPWEVAQIGRTSQVRIWKARFAYNWDWCTRLVPIGIFDDVRLEITRAARISDLHVRPVLSEDLGRAEVTVSVHISAAGTQPLALRAEISLCGGSVGAGLVPPASSGEADATSRVPTEPEEATGVSVSLRLDDPRLWWPNGYGQQPRYRAKVTLMDDDGEPVDAAETTFGVRRVRAVPNDGAPEGALPYVLEVNGRRVFNKGWNWAPISQLYGRTPREKYRRWLELARNAHCNLLRVWGGGLLEKRAFYELCDELGIMVWQEFIQSSSGLDNRPSEAPEYLQYIRGQAERMIPRRRNHPSLILWCGGNELMRDDWTPLDDSHPALATLKDCVQRLDPDRLWLPTSASGPSANAALDKVGRMHDVHGPWQYQGPEAHYELYNGIDPLLHAEFGVEGAANPAAMARCARPELLWPPDDTNPLWLHKGAWWIQRAMITRVFGEISDLDTYVRASQFLQAEGLRYALEANRRRKWHCAGTSPWQFNESWPNLSCTNVVDYYGQPRPAYWWCRRAYEPLHPSAIYAKLGWRPGETFEATLWLNNSLDAVPGCVLKWQLRDLGGSVLAEGEAATDLPAACAWQAGVVRWEVQEVPGQVFILRTWVASPGSGGLPNDYVFSAAAEPVYSPLLSAPPTTINAWREGETVTVVNAAEAWALFLRLEAADDTWMQFGHNHLLLAPGEVSSLECRPAGVPVTVSGWNFGVRRL